MHPIWMIPAAPPAFMFTTASFMFMLDRWINRQEEDTWAMSAAKDCFEFAACLLAMLLWHRFLLVILRRAYESYEANMWGGALGPAIWNIDFTGVPARPTRPSIVEVEVEAEPEAEPETCCVCMGRPAACTGRPCGHAVLCERCMWDWRERSGGSTCVYCTQRLDRIELRA